MCNYLGNELIIYLPHPTSKTPKGDNSIFVLSIAAAQYKIWHIIDTQDTFVELKKSFTGGSLVV